MIPYKSRAGRAIRNILGGVIGAGAVFLATERGHADEGRRAAMTYPTGGELAAACQGHDGWSDPAPPARIFGNTFYVGTCGVSALLVTSDAGHVLIDGATKEAAAGIAANIGKLGFKLADVKWIVASHEHHDHVGGLAELQRLTGARIAALAPQARGLRTGKPDPEDPLQKEAVAFAPVKVGQVLRDGGQVRVGPLRLTAHATPAHTPGSTSWTWTSCEGSICRTMTYADSATAVADDGYDFAAHADRTARARAALARFAVLPCDILLTPHPSASRMFERFSGTEALDDPKACRRYSERAVVNFDARVAPAAKK